MSGLGRDILNFPGNFVRGAGNLAGNVVGGTVHAVTSVGNATGIVPRRLSIDGTPVTLRDKLTLNVKSTPERTAACMTTLSLKSGPLLKKNEQGVWSRRYACLVPHFFLYYFETDSAKEPQGIIDLEFCTDITVQSDNIIRIGANEVYESRTFFFQADNGTLSNEWASSMQRERYGVVKDERDAYHELQDQFSSQLDMAFQQVELSTQEKDRVLVEQTQLKTDMADIEFFIKKLGTLVGVSEEDISNRSDIRTYGEAVILATEQMKSSFASQNAYELEIRKQEHEDLHDKIERLERELEAEVHARRLLEAQNTLEKREAELRLRDAVGEVEKATVLVETLQREHQEAGEKAGELFEQKRILVKEVKQLRKKVAHADETTSELTRLNAELTKSAAELKELVETLQQRNQLESEAALAEAVRAAAQLVDESSKLTDPGQGEQSVQVGAEADSKPENSGEFQWETKRTSLQNLDWLVPEQRTLLEENAHQDPIEPPPSAESSEVPRLKERRGSGSSNSGEIPGRTPYLTDPVETEPTHESLGDKIDKISFSKFVPSMNLTSMFKDKDKEKDKDGVSDTSSNHGGALESGGGLHLPKISFFSSSSNANGGLFSNTTQGAVTPVSSDVVEPPPVHVSSPSAPRCYRCGGTVEGPKYSTCKCAIPAMSPLEPPKDDSNTAPGGENRRGSMSNFMGMLSRGIKTVTPHSSSSHGSFHAALELDENKAIEPAALAAEPSSSANLLFLEVEDAEGNVRTTKQSEDEDLLGLTANEDNATSNVAGTGDEVDIHAHELQADV